MSFVAECHLASKHRSYQRYPFEIALAVKVCLQEGDLLEASSFLFLHFGVGQMSYTMKTTFNSVGTCTVNCTGLVIGVSLGNSSDFTDKVDN